MPAAAAPVRLKPTVPKIIKGAVPDRALPWPIAWEAVLLIADFEKLTLEPYVCPAGVPTNGWGETDGVFMGMAPWTKEVADRRFLESLTQRTAQVRAALRVELNPNQLGACVSLSYNIGVAGFRTSTVCKRLNEGDNAAAVRAFALWNQITVNGKRVISNGLTARRAHEQALFLSPIEDEHHEASPQEVAPESSLTKSPVNLAGVATIGTGAMSFLTQAGDSADKAHDALGKVTAVTAQVGTAATGVRGFLAEFDVTPLEVFGSIALIGGAIVCWYRLKQRRQGWA